jgi:hypothetical protein
LKPVRETVGEHRLNPRPCQKDLWPGDTARRGVAAVRGRDVAPHLVNRPSDRAETEHIRSVAASLRASRHRARKGYPAKNGVEM